jgi:large subunit ribosomal protein L24
MKIRKGDTVLIISGKDKGKKGKVLRVLVDEKRIVIEGANLIKKHQKPKKSGEKGQMVEMSAPMDSSNVKLICQKCSKVTRIGYKVVDNNKYRICKKCGKQI